MADNGKTTRRCGNCLHFQRESGGFPPYPNGCGTCNLNAPVFDLNLLTSEGKHRVAWELPEIVNEKMSCGEFKPVKPEINRRDD